MLHSFNLSFIHAALNTLAEWHVFYVLTLQSWDQIQLEAQRYGFSLCLCCPAKVEVFWRNDCSFHVSYQMSTKKKGRKGQHSATMVYSVIERYLDIMMYITKNMQQFLRLLIFWIQPYMFRAKIRPSSGTLFDCIYRFGTMHRHCCRPVSRLRRKWRSISTVAPVGSSVGALYQKLLHLVVCLRSCTYDARLHKHQVQDGVFAWN